MALRLNQFVKRQMAALQIAGVVLALGTLFAILAPFNTGQLGWPVVWFYWTGLIGFGHVFGLPAAHLLDSRRPDWRIGVRIPILTLASAAPVTVAVIAVNAALALPGRPAWGVIVFYVLVISAAVSTVGLVADLVSRKPVAASSLPDFSRRLPARLAGGAIYAVQAEDHYLRVHTARGDDLILMRLSDALEELAPLDGIRVHRSWWVARAGVEKIRREQGRITLLLRNGRSAPVSRANHAEIRKAGWG